MNFERCKVKCTVVLLRKTVLHGPGGAIKKLVRHFSWGGGRNAGCMIHDADRRLTCGGAGHMREVRNVRIVRHRRLVTGAWKEDML